MAPARRVTPTTPKLNVAAKASAKNLAKHARLQEPITAEEVARWFPEGKYGRPPAQKCERLADHLDRSREIELTFLQSAGRGVEDKVETPQTLAAAHFKEALKAAREFSLEMARVAELAPHSLRSPLSFAVTTANVRAAMSKFLATVPEAERGRPPSRQLNYMTELALVAQEVLQLHVNDVAGKRGLTPPRVSAATQDGPIVKFLIQAARRRFGTDLTPAQILSALKRSDHRSEKEI